MKNGIYKGKGLDLGTRPPRINICWVPPPPPPLTPRGNYKCADITKAKLQSSSKVLERLPVLSLLFLPPPAPGPMLIKTLMFVRVIVLLYPNIEQGGRGIFSKRENSLFSGLKWTTVNCATFPTTFVCDCRLFRKIFYRIQSSLYQI